MPKYPLVITFADVVQAGVASVRVYGELAVLAQLDDGLWTLSGASAGGTEGHGASLEVAYSDFRAELRRVIEDAAAPGRGVEQFAHEISCVFSSVDPLIEHDWNVALDQLRRRELRPDHGTQNLERRPVDSLGVHVEMLPNPAAIGEAIALARPFGKAA